MSGRELGHRIVLVVVSVALAALEAVARVAYRLGYVSFVIPYGASDEERKAAWVARHRRTG